MLFRITLTVLLVLAITLLAGRAFAQEEGNTIDQSQFSSPPVLPEQLPEDPAVVLEWLVTTLAVLTGLVATRVVDAIKQLTWIPEESRNRLAGAAADFVSVILSEIVALVLAGAAYLLGFLDESGLWTVLVWAYPSAKLWFEGQKFTRRGLMSPRF